MGKCIRCGKDCADNVSLCPECQAWFDEKTKGNEIKGKGLAKPVTKMKPEVTTNEDTFGTTAETGKKTNSVTINVKMLAIAGAAVVLVVIGIIVGITAGGKRGQDVPQVSGETVTEDEEAGTGNQEEAKKERYVLLKSDEWECYGDEERYYVGSTTYNEKGYVINSYSDYGDGYYSTTYEYEYDEYGYPVTCTEYEYSDFYGEDTNIIHYDNEYDSEGNIISRTYIMYEMEVVEEFDEDGLVERKIITSGDDYTDTYTYNKKGKIIKNECSDGSYYLYDEYGIQTAYYSEYDSWENEIYYEYDDEGRIARAVTYSDNTKTEYVFDENGNEISYTCYDEYGPSYGVEYEYQMAAY